MGISNPYRTGGRVLRSAADFVSTTKVEELQLEDQSGIDRIDRFLHFTATGFTGAEEVQHHSSMLQYGSIEEHPPCGVDHRIAT
jgi:hypothetical protein